MFSEEDNKDTYLIATLSKLDGIIPRYEKSSLSSKTFFQKLVAENRIHFIHGEQVFHYLRSAYLKISELPTQLHIDLSEEAIHRDNVYFGIVSSDVLKKLYDEFGDALFFENIRDFLGLGEYRAGRSTRIKTS